MVPHFDMAQCAGHGPLSVLLICVVMVHDLAIAKLMVGANAMVSDKTAAKMVRCKAMYTVSFPNPQSARNSRKFK